MPDDGQSVVVLVDLRLEKLIPKFLAVQKDQCAHMRAAFKTLNFSELKLLGHRMKGSCGGYGFSILGELAALIESAAETKDGKKIGEALGQLEANLSNLKVEYTKK